MTAAPKPPNASATTWRNPHHDRRDPELARLLVSIAIFVLLMAALGVLLVRAAL